MKRESEVVDRAGTVTEGQEREMVWEEEAWLGGRLGVCDGWGSDMVEEVGWLWESKGWGRGMVRVGDGCGRVKCGLLRKVSSSGEDGGGRGSETTDRARAVFARGDQWWGLHTSHT